MGRGPLSRALSDAEAVSDVYHYHAESEGVDGQASWTFSDGRWRETHVTQPEALGFSVGELGASDPLRFVMVTTGEAYGDDDRVWFDYGAGIESYRMVEPEPQPFGSEIMVAWKLINDNRGDGAGGTGDSPEQGPDAEPPGDGGGSDGGEADGTTPTNLSGDSNGQYVELQWTEPAESFVVDTINIYVDGVRVDTVGFDTTTYRFEGETSTEYEFYLTSTTLDGAESPASNTITVTTDGFLVRG